MSQTRWSARVDSVRPFAAHIGGLRKAVQDVLQMNLTAETRSDLNGILKYLASFECVILASVWLKILTAIDQRNRVLQARDTTLDVEVANINSLIEDLKTFRGEWSTILEECKLVAENYDIDPSFAEEQKRQKKRKLHADETRGIEENQTPEDKFKHEVFYVLIDCLLVNLTTRYTAVKNLDSSFSILWKYPEEKADVVRDLSLKLCTEYATDVSEDLVKELEHLKTIHPANLGETSLLPLQLLNRLHNLKMDALFPNIVIMLRIFCTLPVTVAEAERSFSTLSRVKNVFRSTMCQDRLTSLGTLAIEARLARQLDYEPVIDMFARAKSRKAPLL